MRALRRFYQVFFFGLFVVAFVLTSQGRLKGYPVTVFLDSSALNAVGTLLSARNIAYTMWIGLLILALTPFIGRFFCGWICPLGTIFHFASRALRPRKLAARIRQNLRSPAQLAKYLILVGLLTAASLGFMQVGLFDPIALLTRTATALASPGMRAGWLLIGIFATLLLLNAWRPRFWCRYICPLGALLGATAKLMPGGVVRNEETCTNCGLCSRDCIGACSPDTCTRMAECFVCWNCVEDCPEGALSWKWMPKRQQLDLQTGMSRRAFLGAATGGVATAAALQTQAVEGYPARVRPPGALAEPDFLDRCLKCGECMKVCPTGVLRPAMSEAGVSGLWTPVMDMERGYCEYNCTLCGQVCPSGAIQRLTIAEKTERPVKTGTAFVDRSRCLPWSFDRNCLVCEEVCPVSPKAIHQDTVEVEIDGKKTELHRPRVNPERCIGCGLCQHECPVNDLAAIRVTAAGESRAPSGSFFLR
ncbi:MAG: 4Fe-4S binding protein [Kiritimatiellae bacterium]|nr:4Fe-4S binding protein [Kiritimatiellia bacterium]